MDVVINPTRDNATKVKTVLDNFIYRINGFMAEKITTCGRPSQPNRVQQVTLKDQVPHPRVTCSRLGSEVDFAKSLLSFNRCRLDCLTAYERGSCLSDDFEII